MRKLTTTILLAGSLLIFSGCEKNLKTPSSKPKIDINLPAVDNTTVRNIPDYQSIALEWKSVTDSNVFGYNIYRSNMQKDGQSLNRVAEIKNKYQTHFLDKGLHENSKYKYSISTRGAEGVESKATTPLMVTTLPRLEAISLVDTISGLPRQIKVLWRPHPNPRVAKYIVEKTTPVQAEWDEVKENEGRYDIEFIDEGLGDNEIYKYRVTAVTFDNIKSIPSQIVTGSTKPLPKNITKLRATQELPREIKLTWEKSVTQDVVSYNFYKSNSVDGSFSKIASAPVAHNTFSEHIQEDGKIYFYKISTVDKDGLESDIRNFRPVMGSTLSKPAVPQLTLSQIRENKSILNWIAGDDRAVSYNIFKVTKQGWSNTDEKMIPGVTGLRFEDPDIVRGVEYEYAIQAVDEHGLVSKKTDYTSLMLPKLVEQKK